MAGPLKLADPERFRIREAKEQDVSAMTEVFFRSFTAPFWQYFIPDKDWSRKWWDEAWMMGLQNPTDVSFVVEDTQKSNKIVAFSRWVLPQWDGNLERKWPEMDPKDWDMEIVDRFFGGMEENRHEMMQKRPHWMLEMLGVHEDYQKHGIGASLLKWGTDQADKEGLETYLDGSEVGQPYYKKRHAFTVEKDIDIPERPNAYGSYHYKSLVRKPQGQKAA
ncbi:acyl-CoA N-acyltransferase [Teratosphaeria destructans]|uniref:Acyl-CoA N-acyltransferase n=1 Tax=Teratosphaeria destructans TaxID=418781 RepID=A0A9W7SN37_9PEZI|nr:acyl-CoA N-acyltransferase [Teratosphaeria destructans]